LPQRKNANAFLHILWRPLGPDTKPEHILLDASGGRMVTRVVDCSACNNLFGNGIDNTFAGQVPEIFWSQYESLSIYRRRFHKAAMQSHRGN
jgi:hypothetical protein